jgi:hypothetical protein
MRACNKKKSLPAYARNTHANLHHVRLAGGSWLVLVCFREKSTAGWLLMVGLFREKSTVGWWLISQTG